jgi:hypothetical protein
MSTLQEAILQGAVSNKTVKFTTNRERNLNVQNNLLNLYPEAEEVGNVLLAKSISKQVGKNVRIIRNRKLLDPGQIQENQECLLKMIDGFFDVFKDLYNSRYFKQGTMEPLEVPVPDILVKLKNKFDSVIRPTDTKCIELSKGILDRVRASRHRNINIIELWALMDLSGDDALEAISQVRRELAESFNDFLTRQNTDMGKLMNRGDINDMIDMWQGESGATSNETYRLLQANFATYNVSVAGRVEMLEIMENQQRGKVDVDDELDGGQERPKAQTPEEREAEEREELATETGTVMTSAEAREKRENLSSIFRTDRATLGARTRELNKKKTELESNKKQREILKAEMKRLQERLRVVDGRESFEIQMELGKKFKEIEKNEKMEHELQEEKDKLEKQRDDARQQMEQVTNQMRVLDETLKTLTATIKTGSGIPTKMDLPVETVLSNRHIIESAPANPELEGQDTFIKEFVEPTAPVPVAPVPVAPVSVTPLITPPVKLPTGPDLKAMKKENIDQINDELDRMVRDGEIKTVSNEDLINVIGGIMKKFQVPSNILSATDISNIIKRFYKEHPNNTLEDKPKNYKFDDASEGTLKMNHLLRWIDAHVKEDILFTDGKPKTPENVLGSLVKHLGLTKPDKLPKNAPIYTWLFDRDLGNVKVTGEDQGVKTTVSMSGRFGIRKLSSDYILQIFEEIKNLQQELTAQKYKEGKPQPRVPLTEIQMASVSKKLYELTSYLRLVTVIEPLFLINHVMKESQFLNVSPEQLQSLVELYKFIQSETKLDIKKGTPQEQALAMMGLAGAIDSIAGIPADSEGFKLRNGITASTPEEGTAQTKAYYTVYNLVKENPQNYKPNQAGSGIKPRRKYKKKTTGLGVKVFRSTAELLERLQSLMDSIDMGNNSLMVRNNIVELLDALKKSRKMTKAEAKQIYDEYVKQ